MSTRIPAIRWSHEIGIDCRIIILIHVHLFQDFPWIKNGAGNVFNEELLYNPVCLDNSLGVDISVNQKLNLIMP